jgi:hypothetical protein
MAYVLMILSCLEWYFVHKTVLSLLQILDSTTTSGTLQKDRELNRDVIGPSLTGQSYVNNLLQP